jgi:FixJ family two-component response regulator
MASPNALPEATVVFVIDDDESIRRALARKLRSVGLAVETFASATEFLGRRPWPAVGCIVTDLFLPGASGLDLQAALAEAGCELPLVFITGHGDVPASVQAMKGGAVDFLLKPFGEAQLLAAIGEALGRSERRRRERLEDCALRAAVATLTGRERQVMDGVVRGLLNKQIAAELGVAEATVKIHRGRVMAKLSVDSVPELVRLHERLR